VVCVPPPSILLVQAAQIYPAVPSRPFSAYGYGIWRYFHHMDHSSSGHIFAFIVPFARNAPQSREEILLSRRDLKGCNLYPYVRIIYCAFLLSHDDVTFWRCRTLSLLDLHSYVTL
jgi:hypothetical protein